MAADSPLCQLSLATAHGHISFALPPKSVHPLPAPRAPETPAVPVVNCQSCQGRVAYHSAYRCFQCRGWFDEGCMAKHLVATHNTGGDRVANFVERMSAVEAEHDVSVGMPPGAVLIAAPRAETTPPDARPRWGLCNDCGREIDGKDRPASYTHCSWCVRLRDLEHAVNTACQIIEVGDQRLLASDGPAGGQPPDISLDEWVAMYRALSAARAGAPRPGVTPIDHALHPSTAHLVMQQAESIERTAKFIRDQAAEVWRLRDQFDSAEHAGRSPETPQRIVKEVEADGWKVTFGYKAIRMREGSGDVSVLEGALFDSLDEMAAELEAETFAYRACPETPAPTPEQMCFHWGEGGARCILPSGHNGAHHYQRGYFASSPGAATGEGDDQ